MTGSPQQVAIFAFRKGSQLTLIVEDDCYLGEDAYALALDNHLQSISGLTWDPTSVSLPLVGAGVPDDRINEIEDSIINRMRELFGWDEYPLVYELISRGGWRREPTVYIYREDRHLTFFFDDGLVQDWEGWDDFTTEVGSIAHATRSVNTIRVWLNGGREARLVEGDILSFFVERFNWSDPSVHMLDALAT